MSAALLTEEEQKMYQEKFRKNEFFSNAFKEAFDSKIKDVFQKLSF